MAKKPRKEEELPEWITVPTCSGCLKQFYKPCTPGHPLYPKNPRPGDFFYVDICDNVHRFGGMTGPKPTRPDPKDIELDQKKVADYIKEKQAQKDKELEESNKKAEDMLAKDMKEQEEAKERLLKGLYEKMKPEEREAFAEAALVELRNISKGFTDGPMP